MPDENVRPFVLPRVTRISVIDHRAKARKRGLVIEVRNCKVSTDIQDEGRTLKVWINDQD